MKGIIFDIKEFALNDGAGIRTTVFFKGCPLRCIWCHNPEGLSSKRELYVKKKGCLGCKLCNLPCDHEECQGFGRCLHICPKNLVSIAGVEWEAEALATRLLKDEAFFNSCGGGITLSGGEPLLQAEFAYELLSLLEGRVHRCIETSGYADKETFRKVIEKCDFVIMDIKLFDSDEHKKYTGVGNEKILENARFLKGTNKPHMFRVPLIPGITDTDENLRAIAEFVGEDRVELMSYNKLAPAKYESVGRKYTDLIDGEREINANLSLFKNATLRK
ncbi:MAG: glycyl-radical enzyme activating protein [Clostridia bacterium]|nr:glycyl-radical enzyme activating protein [Clostridia bacterium]